MRHAGNEAAHDVDVTVSQADATDIIEFTNAILDYLFSYRDRFDKFKARRANRAYRDRDTPHKAPLPHHAAYGSVLRDSADQAESDPGKHKTK